MKIYWTTLLFIIVTFYNLYPQFYNLNSDLKIPEKINSVVFTSKEIGYFAGGHGTLYKTINGGIEWSKINSGTDAEIKKIFFINSLEGWYYTADTLMKTSDGGATWNGICNSRGGHMVYFQNKNTGWIADNTYLYKSTDGGSTWTSKLLFSLGYSKAMRFFDDNLGFTVGLSTCLTTNGGNKWFQCGPFSDNDAYFNSPSSIIAVGTRGQIKLIRSWTDYIWQTSNTTEDLNSVHFTQDTSIGYIVGNRGTVLYSTNYGAHWSNCNINTFFDLYSVWVLDTNNVWISGEELLYTNHTGVFKFDNLRDTTVNIDTGLKILIHASGIPKVKYYLQDAPAGVKIDSLSGELSWVPSSAGDYIIIIKGVNNFGSLTNSFHIKVEPYTMISDDNMIVRNNKLLYNYPNPFNPTTTIRYQLQFRERITLKVFDILGREVATLVNDEKPPGVYSVIFDAGKLLSGIYFYRVQAGNFVETKKMILMK